MGFRGYPLGTIAFYGPDNEQASKVAVGVFLSEGADPEDMQKWFCATGDLRRDATVLAQIMDYLHRWDVHTVTMVSGIIGCPHEEGVDYPEGESCPKCPFWANRDRWAG